MVMLDVGLVVRTGRDPSKYMDDADDDVWQRRLARYKIECKQVSGDLIALLLLFDDAHDAQDATDSKEQVDIVFDGGFVMPGESHCLL